MDSSIETLVTVLSSEGLKAGLQLLNQRVPHRWTAVYKLDRGILHSIQIVDKENAVALGNLSAFPLVDSFCHFALKDGMFVSENTAEDPDERLIGHPRTGVINAYVGLPLMKGVDEIYGTFCHFDLVQQPLSDQEFDFLKQVSCILPNYV